MGILYSVYNYFGFGVQGRTDDPDPVTGLTSRDKYLITSTWAVVRKNPTDSGVALLSLLFKNHPEHQKLFPFRDVPRDKLADHKRFQAHANSVVYSFSSIVDALDENELLVTILTKVGESHVPRNVGEKEFLDLKDAIIELFSTLFTPDEVKAWQKVLDVAFGVMNKAMNETSQKLKKRDNK